MLGHMTLTHFLALMIGLYFIAASVGMLAKPEMTNRLLPAMVENPMLIFLTGLVVFVIGGTLVAVHNLWTDWLTGFVSLVGWVAWIEGLLFLAFGPALTAWFAKIQLSTTVIMVLAVFVFALGLALSSAVLIAG